MTAPNLHDHSDADRESRDRSANRALVLVESPSDATTANWRHVDRVTMRSVFATTLVVALALAVAMCAGATTGWWLATRAGFVDNVESFLSDLVGAEVEVVGWRLLLIFAGAAALGSVVLAAAAAVVAAVFNMSSRLTGGVTVRLSRRERRVHGRRA